MSTLATQVVVHAGTAPTYSSASTADACATGGGVVLHVLNGGTASRTVTIVTPETVDGLAVTDRTVTVGTAAAGVFIPITSLYKDTDGLAHITYDDITSVTVAVLRVP
jgi:hypothetical protein